jgi:hypothetical protein
MNAIPAGRAAAREIAEFVGIVNREHSQGFSRDASIAVLPPDLQALEEELGFRLLLPSYLPKGIKLQGVQKLPEAEQALGVQSDYIAEADSRVVSIRQMKSPGAPNVLQLAGERIVVQGHPAILSSSDRGVAITVVQWIEDGVIVEVAGVLPRDEIVRIANSLK